MRNIIGFFRNVEAWVNKKTAEHPGWNVLTWVGHGTVGAAYALVFFGFGFGEMGIAAAFGAYSWHEVTQLYRRHKYPATWNKFWKVFDPVMDIVSPTVVAALVAFWLA